MNQSILQPSVSKLSEAETEVFNVLLRQMERGRVVEWAGLQDISPEELCGWLLMIYNSKKNNPALAQQMDEIGSRHLQTLKTMDKKWYEAMLRAFWDPSFQDQDESASTPF